jgi:hypothetical protein
MLMSLAVPLMLLSAWMLTPAALMLLLTLATATIDKEAERSTKTTVQLSNIDAGAGGISLTANDKHSNDKHADNNARFGVGGFKGCFDVGIVVGGAVYVSICGS